eukprot:s8703_g1.t1
MTSGDSGARREADGSGFLPQLFSTGRPWITQNSSLLGVPSALTSAIRQVAHAMSPQSSETRVEKSAEAAFRMAEDPSAAPQPADSCKERRLCLACFRSPSSTSCSPPWYEKPKASVLRMLRLGSPVLPSRHRPMNFAGTETDS